MRNEIIGKPFDEERALYHLCNTDVLDCRFAGPADGESALKEARDVKIENCAFSLRYPLWHADTFRLHDSRMDELTRAPIWYAKNVTVIFTASRPCGNVTISVFPPAPSPLRSLAGKAAGSPLPTVLFTPSTCFWTAGM